MHTGHCRVRSEANTQNLEHHKPWKPLPAAGGAPARGAGALDAVKSNGLVSFYDRTLPPVRGGSQASMASSARVDRTGA